MGYVVKHSTSNVNKTRRKGKVAIGVDSGGYSKTSVSGFYAGVPPVEGKHNFVRTAAGGNPNFYSLTDEELINFVNGLGERNLTTLTPSQGGWAGSYSVVDSDTRTFNLTTQQNNAATTSAWRTFYWDVSAYQGQTVAISADVEFVSETNCNWLNFTIGQGNTGQYPIHIAGSDAADRVSISSKPTTSVKMAWSGSINATGIVGFTFWINNVTTNGANSVTKVSNVQIEAQDHVTEYSNPDKVVLTSFEALQYLSDREDIMFTDNIATKNIVTDGLVLDLNSRIKSSFRDNLPTENSARVDTWQSTWNNSGTATWNSNDTNVPRFFPDITVHSMVKDTNGNSHLGVGYTTNISEGVECTYSLYVWIPSSNSAGMSGAPPYMRPFPANYNATYLSYNGSTSWGSWPRDQWIRIEGTATPTSNANGGVSTAYISSYLNTAGDVVYYTAPQFENKSSATPFVSGSRSQNTTWYDLSGYGANGTLINGPTFNSNGWIDFDGTNDYTQIVGTGFQNDVLPSSSYVDRTATFMATVKYDSATGAGAVITRWGNSLGQTWWFGRYGAGNTIHLALDTSTGYKPFYSNTSIGTDTSRFYHIAATVNGGNYTFYNNGKEDGTGTYTGTWDVPPLCPVLLGAQNTGSAVLLNGKIASAKVYSKALSESEVKQNYYGGPIVTDGLVLAVDAGNLVSYESGSTTAYSLTGSLSGSLLNGTGYSSSNGGTFVFDGANDQINLGSPSSLSNAQFTITFWYNPSTLMNISYNGIINGKTPGGKFCLFWINGTTLSVQYQDNSGLAAANGGVWTRSQTETGAVSETNKWYFIQITGNETTDEWRVGVNLNVSTSDFGSQYVSPNNSWLLGASTIPDHGKIANLQIYDRILSQGEIEQNYNAQKARFI